MTTHRKRSWLAQLILQPHTVPGARSAVLKSSLPRGMRIPWHPAIVIVRRVRDDPDPRDGVQDELVMALNALDDLDGDPVLLNGLLGVKVHKGIGVAVKSSQQLAVEQSEDTHLLHFRVGRHPDKETHTRVIVTAFQSVEI